MCRAFVFWSLLARVSSASLHQSGSPPICERMPTVAAATADSVVFKTQPGRRDWSVSSPKVPRVHKSAVCTTRFHNLSGWISVGTLSANVEHLTSFTVSVKFNRSPPVSIDKLSVSGQWPTVLLHFIHQTPMLCITWLTWVCHCNLPPPPTLEFFPNGNPPAASSGRQPATSARPRGQGGRRAEQQNWNVSAAETFWLRRIGSTEIPVWLRPSDLRIRVEPLCSRRRPATGSEAGVDFLHGEVALNVSDICAAHWEVIRSAHGRLLPRSRVVLFQSDPCIVSAVLSWFGELTTALVTFESRDWAVCLPLRKHPRLDPRQTKDRRHCRRSRVLL